MRKYIVFVLAAMPLCAGAQQAESLNGNWTGTLENPQGRELRVQVAIDGTAGKWRVVTSGRGNPCANRDLPFSISNQSSTNFSFKLNGSSVTQGCSDQAIALKLTDPKALTGTVEDGRKVNLVRE